MSKIVGREKEAANGGNSNYRHQFHIQKFLAQKRKEKLSLPKVAGKNKLDLSMDAAGKHQYQRNSKKWIGEIAQENGRFRCGSSFKGMPPPPTQKIVMKNNHVLQLKSKNPNNYHKITKFKESPVRELDIKNYFTKNKENSELNKLSDNTKNQGAHNSLSPSLRKSNGSRSILAENENATSRKELIDREFKKVYSNKVDMLKHLLEQKDVPIDSMTEEQILEYLYFSKYGSLYTARDNKSHKIKHHPAHLVAKGEAPSTNYQKEVSQIHSFHYDAKSDLTRDKTPIRRGANASGGILSVNRSVKGNKSSEGGVKSNAIMDYQHIRLIYDNNKKQKSNAAAANGINPNNVSFTKGYGGYGNSNSPRKAAGYIDPKLFKKSKTPDIFGDIDEDKRRLDQMHFLNAGARYELVEANQFLLDFDLTLSRLKNKFHNKSTLELQSMLDTKTKLGDYENQVKALRKRIHSMSPIHIEPLKLPYIKQLQYE